MAIIDPPMRDGSVYYTEQRTTTTTSPEKNNLDVQEMEAAAEIIPHAEQQVDDLKYYSLKNTISQKRKWLILLIVALQGFLGPLTSSIYVPAIAQVRKSFNASDTTINATISLYVFTMGLAPLVWASLSERYGRRTIYLLATLIYLLSTIGCALSKNVGLFIVLRIFQATGASAAQAVGAGTITDLFDMHERGNAMGLFLLGPLVGPVVGPIAGGFINEYLDWRYIFWFLAIMGGLIFMLILFFLPETSAVILKRRSQYKEEKEKKKAAAECGGIMDQLPHCSKQQQQKQPQRQQESILRGISRPFKFIIKPVVILATTPYSIAYGFMYFVIASLPHQLTYHYNFVSYQIGLSYLANGVGNALGALVSGKMADRALVESEQPGVPEVRLSPMWWGILLLPVGELMYGWCIQYNVHFMASLTGLFLLGLGVGIVQTPSNTYIVDAYQKHSASVMSAANLLRCVSAGCTPLIAPTLIGHIGNGWSMTILAIIGIMSGICIFLVQKYGQTWRLRDNTKNL